MRTALSLAYRLHDMPSFEINNFYGVVPRLHPADLKPGYAAEAHDVRLSHGTLKAWRERLPVESVPLTSKTVYQWGCCWFAWDKCVEVAPWLPDCPRLYVTGDYPYPVVGVLNDDCSIGTDCCPQVTWMRLGVPDPGYGPSAAATAPAPMSSASEGRDYVYTYVSCLCEEGQPSYPSNEIIVDDGVPVTLTGFATPPAEWCVKEINIYRRVTGFRTGREQVQEHVTDFFLVGTIPIGTATFIDVAKNREIGRALPSREYAPPPAELRGITAVLDTKTLVGFYKNKLRFSNNGQPWNWPEAQELTLDSDIVAIRSVGTTVYVATTGAPYVVQGDLACNERACRQVTRHEYPHPMIVCCTDRGSVATPFGMVYVSADGLVLLSGTATPQVITDQWFGQDDWRQLKPETMRLGYYAGSLFCISDTYAFMMVIDTKTYANWETYKLSTLSDRPIFMYLGDNGEFFMLENGVISQWNAANVLRPYRWKSKLIEMPAYLHFSAGRVWVDGNVEMILYASEHEVFRRIPPGRQSFRIPRYGHHLLHEIAFEGIGTVWGTHMATSKWDLREAGSRTGGGKLDLGAILRGG